MAEQISMKLGIKLIVTQLGYMALQDSITSQILEMLVHAC